MRLGLACLLLFTGCDLYFTNGDDDVVCAAGELAPAKQLRNPETGECTAWGFPGCDDPCLPCGAVAELTPAPDWGTCFGECEALDEAACIDQPSCRAIYDANSNIDEAPRFLQCWAIAPSGPAPGRCEGLDAQECSRHDNCSAYYDDRNGLLEFFACKAEEGPTDVCATADCAPGTHCEAQCQGGGTGDPFCSPVCVPDQDLCGTMDCSPGTECVQTCTGGGPAGCGTCTAECVPVGMCESLTSEAACVGRADCTAVYSGDNCTCTGDGSCTCEILEFARCQAL